MEKVKKGLIIETECPKDARMIAEHTLNEMGILDYNIYRVQRVELKHCGDIIYRVYVEYEQPEFRMRPALGNPIFTSEVEILKHIIGERESTIWSLNNYIEHLKRQRDELRNKEKDKRINEQ